LLLKTISLHTPPKKKIPDHEEATREADGEAAMYGLWKEKKQGRTKYEEGEETEKKAKNKGGERAETGVI